jgi:DNA (cytosine-5)-methyltransferase 1
MKLVLSLFPGIDLLGRGFEEEGFCVVRGPDIIWGGDVKKFHAPPGRFDGVIGGPPCQRFSALAKFVEHNGLELAEDLIPEFSRVVNEARPLWFLMENVEAAPLPQTPMYSQRSVIFNNRWAGGEQHRVRRFTFGIESRWQNCFEMASEDALLESVDRIATVTASGTMWDPERKGKNRKGGIYGEKSERMFRLQVRAQGLPDDFDLPNMTVRGKVKAVGNGVPLPMARAVARAVKKATE